jgi:hypothetical protein
MKTLLPLFAALGLLTATGCTNRSKPPPTTTQVDPDDPESVRKAQEERRFRDQVYMDMYEGRNGL